MTPNQQVTERLFKPVADFIPYPRLGSDVFDRDPDSVPNRIYALLDQHLDNPMVNVDWLADQLGINRKRLYRQLHQQLQLTPTELIRRYRLRKAIALLTVGHTMTETAYLVGFNTPSHFARVFRQCYQQTPTAYLASLVPDCQARLQPVELADHPALLDGLRSSC